MTYSPPPFQPPRGPLGYDPQSPLYDALGPARRASVMLWIFGGLGALCGICLGSFVWIAPVDQLITQLRSGLSQEQLNQLGNVDLVRIARIVYTIFGIIALLVSIVILTLATSVRRGSRGPTIGALVIYILLALGSGFGVLVCLIEAIVVNPVALLGGVLWLTIGAGAGLTLFWLVKSLRSSNEARNQIQAAYFKLHQQQAGLLQPGYGYGTPAGYPQQPAAPQQALGPIPPPPEEPPSSSGSI